MAHRERGMALLLAIFAVAALAGLVLEFDRATQIDLIAAGNFRDAVRAMLLAKAGVAAGQAILKDDALRGSVYDGRDEPWGAVPPISTGEGSIGLAIDDESGKLNPNHLVGGPGGQKVGAKIAQMRRLVEALKLDSGLVDAIIDWVDPDKIPESAGAEDSYYAALDPPYRARNGPLESLSELHLIRGVTDEVYRTLSPYLTVMTSPPGRVNVNTAGPVVLQALDRRISADLAGRIVQARPFRKLDDLDQVAGMEQIARELRGLQQAYDVRSDTFLIRAQGQAHDTRRLVLAAVERVRAPQRPPVVRLLSWRME